MKKNKNKIINARILDILFQTSSKDSTDAHWDSYNDSYYHDEYRDGFVGEKAFTKVKK